MTTEQDGSKTEGRGGLVHIRTDRGLWREDARGYTDRFEEAACWTRAEAERMTDHLGPEKCLQLIPAEPRRGDVLAHQERMAELKRKIADARELADACEIAIQERVKEHAALEVDLERVQCELDVAELTLASERQRRDEAEAVIREICNGTLSAHGWPEIARNHFRKYEPIPADREEERDG